MGCVSFYESALISNRSNIFHLTPLFTLCPLKFLKFSYRELLSLTETVEGKVHSKQLHSHANWFPVF